MRILVTGSKGFIGKNLVLKLKELGTVDIVEFNRGDSLDTLKILVNSIDFVIHLAGVNRPSDKSEFFIDNVSLTQNLCNSLLSQNKNIPIIFTSSTQATLDNLYGVSKEKAENIIKQYSSESKSPAIIYRLPGVFGKWCEPNYNSVVATFCHNIATDQEIHIEDSEKIIDLVYIDDVVSSILKNINLTLPIDPFPKIEPIYSTSIGNLASQIKSFRDSRISLMVGNVGGGLEGALYSTYISYLPTEKFTYSIPPHRDERGIFVEVIKTPSSGQISLLNAPPGVTRGEHYHHSKTEKFFVAKGKAKIRFRNILTNKLHEVICSDQLPEIVETIPGWVHDITNIGDQELLVIIWANELFDHSKPDTTRCKV